MKTKICIDCHRVLSLDNYTIDRSRLDGYNYKCKDCCAKRRDIYYNNNRDEILRKSREHYNINKEKIQEERRHNCNRKYSQYKSAAKIYGRIFNISLEEFISVVTTPCNYCGSYDNPNGLDRVDNEIGYVLDNVVSCCGICNSMKNNLLLSEFIDKVSKIYKYWIVDETGNCLVT